MQKEPVAIVAAIVAVAQLIVPGLVIFGVVSFSVEQLAFVEVFVTSVSLAIGAVVARASSTPVV
jgi:hypothetical protein